MQQSFLSQYRREVELASEDAKKYIQAITETYNIAYPEASVAEIRNCTLEAINDALNVFGDQASLIANDFFDQLAEMAGEDITAEMYDSLNTERIDKSLHYYAKNLVEGNNAKFEKNIADLTSFHVKRAAFENLEYNCKKNGLAYARVPTGRETCAFCFILASRGFDYGSEYAAGGKGNKYHPNCDCIIVPGFHSDTGINEDTQIQGYKPSEMRKRYQKCYDAINPNGTWEEVFELWKNSGSEDTWGKFKTKALVKEINTRDWKWVWNGTPAKIDKSIIGEKGYDNLEAHEKATWEILAKKHGLGFQILPERSKEPASIDATYRGVLWELKNPKSGKHAVEDRIKDACGKWDKLGLSSSPKIILSNSESTRDDWDVFQEAIRRCRHYGADELIFVSHDGEKLYRWKK